MRRPRRSLVLTAVTGSTLLGGLVAAAPALAHAEVVATTPTAGSTVHGTITQVSVTFDEAVSLVPHALRVTTDAGIPVAIENPRLSQKGTILSARVQDHLAAGRYHVAWRAQADDGHLESSTFTFAVAGAGTSSPMAAPAAPPPVSPGEPLWPVLVAAALALLGGAAAGIAVRRGLRAVMIASTYPFGHEASPQTDEALRLPM